MEEISTTGDAAAIRLRADRASIAADRRDVVHLMVSIEDAQGRVVPGADNEVPFAIEGEGCLIGVDNGDLLSQESIRWSVAAPSTTSASPSSSRALGRGGLRLLRRRRAYVGDRRRAY